MRIKALGSSVGRVLRQRAPVERDALTWLLVAFALALLPNVVLSLWTRWEQEGLLDFFHLLCVLLVPRFFGLPVWMLLWILWPLAWVGPGGFGLPHDHSIASPAFRQGPRIVTPMGGGVEDYDPEILHREKQRGRWKPLKKRDRQPVMPPESQ